MGVSEQHSQLPKKFGDYWLIRKIATGGMAEIFLARTRDASGAEKYFALKMIHPRYLEERHFHQMIVEEAKVAVRLQHPNVGQVFDLGCVNGRYFIVMEFIDGYDLSRLHAQCRQRHIPIPLDVAAYVGREVCAALDYAHNVHLENGQALNLIHRDISPQNILVSFQGDIKIIDFGIAKVSTQVQQTQVGVIKGKFYYMSPEQAGAADVDQRSDLFSLGICLWETVTGQSLFRRDGGPTNPLAILHEIRTMPIPRVREYRSNCPPALDDAICRALSRDLTSRYANAGEMYHAFDAVLQRYAPSFDPSVASAFMVRAYEKVETTKEIAREKTEVFNLMQRGDFAPSDASVIFDFGSSSVNVRQPAPLGDGRALGARDATALLDVSQPEQMISGVADAMPNTKEHPQHYDPPSVSSTELAVSETVFLLADDVAEMERMGERPETMGQRPSTTQETDRITGPLERPADVDPNMRTQAISLADIHAAHAQHQAANTASFAERAEEFRSHPLFRWLVLALVLMCLFGAMVTMMLHQRGKGATEAPQKNSLLQDAGEVETGFSDIRRRRT